MRTLRCPWSSEESRVSTYAERVEAPGAVEPATGLAFIELSHPWDFLTPVWPGHPTPAVQRAASHASHGVLTHKIVTTMHAGTHVNAPIHHVPGAQRVGELDLSRFFGSAVVIGLDKGEWGLIEPADLEAAEPKIQPQDVVLINTGWHRHYGDTQHYFGHGPGLSAAAADWLVERDVKLVGIDTGSVDHPLATSLASQRNGPLIPYLPSLYRERTGRDPKQDFPAWNPAHKTLLAAGIPTIENVGGDIDALTGGRCTVVAFPWDWREGDASIIRLMAVLDPTGDYRLAAGS
jgi:kynurenine formamidase